jgi:hypothetical protein
VGRRLEEETSPYLRVIVYDSIDDVIPPVPVGDPIPNDSDSAVAARAYVARQNQRFFEKTGSSATFGIYRCTGFCEACQLCGLPQNRPRVKQPIHDFGPSPPEA